MLGNEIKDRLCVHGRNDYRRDDKSKEDCAKKQATAGETVTSHGRMDPRSVITAQSKGNSLKHRDLCFFFSTPMTHSREQNRVTTSIHKGSKFVIDIPAQLYQ